MATNDNPSIKSLNELLWMFMRQAAVEINLPVSPVRHPREPQEKHRFL